MSRKDNLIRISAVHTAIGPLSDEVVYVGGATVSLYADRPVRLFNGKDYASEIKERKLWLDTKTGYYRTYGYKYMKLDGAGVFFIEAAVKLDKAGSGFKSHGIMWGVKDQSNYDYFIISDQGSFQTGYVHNGIDVKTLA